ncbi:iron-containing redox enzyme family protein [Acinetobacter nosocomialis]|uniref:iron-containing redox enzyme family protein n=1 Tax=Acinetobacter nosocomialis TaxID=106654 RepID=UPI0021CEA492|nr:iron-containing redox enzyme family protein [Acinetobacter nosocomialis]MCU4552463.1 iron-containing redox enzyme family protein [Acinetobacter nosocomialis]
MPKKFENFNNPRKKALAGMKQSISTELWDKNLNFLTQLRAKIAQHPVSHHPAIETLNNGEINKENLKRIHLEYRHAIVQTFTDALLMAQYQTKQLEPRLHAGAKMFPRFLLSLNIFDEFGFRPGADRDGYYQGNPEYAHYPLFEDVLNDFGVTEEERRSYKPTSIAHQVREFLENSYNDYKAVSALLAVAEEEVILYSPPLRRATSAVGIEVEGGGYYHVHGVSEDKTAEAADDDHEEDLWFILMQACTEEDYIRLENLCLEYCDLWKKFWDVQMENSKSMPQQNLV